MKIMTQGDVIAGNGAEWNAKEGIRMFLKFLKP